VWSVSVGTYSPPLVEPPTSGRPAGRLAARSRSTVVQQDGPPDLPKDSRAHAWSFVTAGRCAEYIWPP